MSTELITNGRIAAKQVRLIENETMVGVVPTTQALLRAGEQGLDLVVVAGGDPPVCRILDADRFRFERAKQEREQARRQRELQIDTKEIQLRPVTGDGDLSMKARRAKSFLEAGDKVRVTVRFRGRERSHKAEGRRVIARFMAEVGEHKVERPLIEGEADLTMILASLVTKSEKLRQKSRETA